MNSKRKIVNNLKELVDQYETIFLQNINPSRENDEIFICAYFLSVLEYSRGINVLIEDDNLVSIVPLFRSLLETVVDISNLCKYEDYYLYLRKEQLKKTKNRYEKWYKEQENEFFPNVDQLGDDFRISMKKVKGELSKIYKKGFSFTKKTIARLEIREKFKLADIEKVHSSVWDLTSSDIHNDLSSISNRHIIENPDGEIIITKTSKLRIADIGAHIITVPGLLFSALGEIFERFDLNKDEIESIYQKKNESLKNLLGYKNNESRD